MTDAVNVETGGAVLLVERYRIDCRPMTSHGLNGLLLMLSIFNSEDQIDLLMTALGEGTE